MSDPTSKTSASNKSCVKMLAILEFLAQYKAPARLLDIAQGLNYSSTTVLRFLTTLQQCGYIAQDAATQRYYLTYKLCYLSNNIEASNSLQNITHPHLLALSDLFQESMCVSVEDHWRMVYIDVVTEVNQPLKSFVHVGNIVPMHCTGNGKLILATFSPDKLDRFIAERGLPAYTERTITTREALLQEVEKIRANGYAEVCGEREIGMSCFSYPIYNYTGHVVAGISVTGPSTRVNLEKLGDRLHFLKDSADQISKQLGYHPEK